MLFTAYSQFTNVAAGHRFVTHDFKGNVEMKFRFWIDICSLVPISDFIVCQTSQLYIYQGSLDIQLL